MLLSAPDGSYIETHLVDYEVPVEDDNWLLVSIAVSTPQGHGASVDPCLRTQEIRKLITWFVALEEGVPVMPSAGGLESNLEFERLSASAESVMLRVCFIIEHGLWYPADGRRAVRSHSGYLDFELFHSDLWKVATDWAGELERFPPIVPECPLPSPYFLPFKEPF